MLLTTRPYNSSLQLVLTTRSYEKRRWRGNSLISRHPSTSNSLAGGDVAFPKTRSVWTSYTGQGRRDSNIARKLTVFARMCGQVFNLAFLIACDAARTTFGPIVRVAPYGAVEFDRLLPVPLKNSPLPKALSYFFLNK